MNKIPVIETAADFRRHFEKKFWRELAVNICRRHRINFQNLSRSNHGENVVFLLDDKFILKIYTPFRNGFGREKAALEFISETRQKNGSASRQLLKTPEIIGEGKIENFDYLILTLLEGELMTREIWLTLNKNEQTRVITQLAHGLRVLHSISTIASAPEKINFDWREFLARQAESVLERQKNAGANPEWLESLPKYLEKNLPLLECENQAAEKFLHGDVHFGNLRLSRTEGNWSITGLFDFADSLKGFHEYDFVAPGVLMIQGQGELQREFFRAYGYQENEINEVLRRRLMLLTILYECSDLRKYALRLKPEALGYTLLQLEKAIWSFVKERKRM